MHGPALGPGYQCRQHRVGPGDQAGGQGSPALGGGQPGGVQWLAEANEEAACLRPSMGR